MLFDRSTACASITACISQATKVNSSARYVLKRLFVEKGEHIRWSGLREIYFGQKHKRSRHVGTMAVVSPAVI